MKKDLSTKDMELLKRFHIVPCSMPNRPKLAIDLMKEIDKVAHRNTGNYKLFRQLSNLSLRLSFIYYRRVTF